MVLVLLFFICIFVIFFFVSSLTLQIDIRNLKVNKEYGSKSKINKDYEIIINAYILKKITIFRYKINKKIMQKKYFEKVKNKIDFSILKSFFLTNYNISNVTFIDIENLNLNLNLGTPNVIFTSGIVTILNTIFSMVISKSITKYSNEKYYYEIKALYENKIDLFLETKIRIKLFSLMKSIKIYYLEKNKVYKNKTDKKKILINNVN